MELNPLELVTQYGVLGSLLFLFMYWLVRHYLPEHQQQHREELERILSCHDRATNRLVDSVERQTRIIYFNSQALLVQSFIKSGLSRAEAEEIADRIAVAVAGAPEVQ